MTRLLRCGLSWVALGLAAGTAAQPAGAASCGDLAKISLANAIITSAQPVEAGAFKAPGNAQGSGGNPFGSLPAFCRMEATLTPSSDSDIKIEIWLPLANWNRKLQSVGNGGWAGVISYSALAAAIREGYAAASTDTGHVGGSGSFALGHPEKLIDFVWRSEHEMTLKAKAIAEAFYGSAPRLSYWNGCSAGGRQGLKEAQMFPNDYDGIIAGAPANAIDTAISLWIAFAVLKDKESYIPPAKYPVIHDAAIAACDAQDGLKDGLITDPSKCRFDPQVLLCKNGDGPACLTAPQVGAARKIYTPAKNPRTGADLFLPLVPGSELGWAVMARGPEPLEMFQDLYRYVLYKDPNWDWRTFDFDNGIAKGKEPDNIVMNATDPNLKSFFGHDGKLLLYHGWSDPIVSPLNTVKYYNSVLDTMGGISKVSNNLRLFMEPGMGHCGGGEGPNVFDRVGALEQWVEQKKAPESIIASHSTAGKVDRTRPLCPYPQVAKYKGTGSIDDAANFACAVP